MKHITLALAAFVSAVSLALAVPANAQTRDDIMDRVIWPCVAHEVEELDLEEHHAGPAATIMFELDRDYYEEVIDAVEAALRDHPNDAEAMVYEAGLAACIQNQGSWSDELVPSIAEGTSGLDQEALSRIMGLAEEIYGIRCTPATECPPLMECIENMGDLWPTCQSRQAPAPLSGDSDG